ncbi:MAG: response regulator transcription factor [Anaerolineae bacterium]|nr:MAG: response regulator transcription factor [Anaerolineae bacterium]
MKILVVDDEPQIRKLLKTGLGGYGYEVITAANGQEALILAAQQAPQLIILDISLGSPPDGIEVCRSLREWSKTPIIMLSVRNEDKAKVTALDAGADDYLTKPFSLEELRARIQAVLRRMTVEPTGSNKSEIEVGDLRIELAKHRVFVQEEEVHLTPKEYELLRLLATHSGRVLTHEAILNHVWGPEYSGMDHYVRVFVNQLRKKLRENPARNIRYILNEPGIGYRFIDIE